MKDEQLNRQLRAMIDGAAAPLSQAEVVLRANSPARKARRDWYLTEHRLIVVAVAAAIVVVFFVPLPRLSLFNRLTANPAVTSSSGINSLPSVDLSATPAGWVPVAYGDAQVSVPSDWKVEYEQACWLWHAPGTVEVGPGGGGYCPAYGNGNKAAPVVALGPRPALVKVTNGPRESVNGLTLVRYFHSAAETSYFVPSLDVTLTLMGAGAQRVVHTLTRSPRKVVLADGPAPKIQPTWRRITFAGVSIAVPPLDIVGGNHGGVVFPRTANWAVNRIDWFGSACLAFQATAMTGNPLVVLDTDEKLEQAYCLAPPSYTFVQSVSNGLRIDRVPTRLFPTATAYGKCLQISGLTACPATAYPYSVLVLKVTVPGQSKPVIVSIGLAGNGMIARTILYSLRPATTVTSASTWWADSTWTSPTTGWVLGEGTAGCTTCLMIQHTDNGGRTWTAVSAPSGARFVQVQGSGDCQLPTETGGMYGVAQILFVNSLDGYLFDPSLFTTTDGGRTWHRQPGGTAELDMVSPGEVWRVACGSPSSSFARLLAQRAGSSTWVAVPAPALGIAMATRVQIVVSGPSRAIVATYGNIAGGAPSHTAFILTANAGRTWTSRADPCGSTGRVENDAVDVAASGDGSVVVECQSKEYYNKVFVLVSHDGGRSFGVRRSIPSPNAFMIAVPSSNTIVLATGNMGGAGPFTYTIELSTDGGLKWQAALRDPETLPGNGGSSLTFASSTVGYWIGYGNRLWTTADAGRHWSPVNP